MNDDLEFRIAKLSLAPDDILVAKFKTHLSPDARLRVQSVFRASCGSDRKILILEGDTDLGVLTRAEIEARPQRPELRDRIGTFTIQKRYLDAVPDWLQQLMAQIIVLKADYAIFEDGIKYTALCWQFALTKPGYPPRNYHALVEDDRFLRFE